jgi:hypothetical protein
MNLWAKRIGQLAIVPIALFFFACEDEASLLGYKNPNTKFEVKYIEIPLESSVLLLDSQRTSNYLFNNETNRLLVGQYVDQQFGSITSTAFTQYFTTTGAKLAAGAVFDSVSIQLAFDLYNYGSKVAATPQTVSVYEVDEVLSKGIRNYFSTTDVAIKPDVLGSKVFTIDPAKFADDLKILSDGNSANDTLVSPALLKMPLNSAFGAKIFESAKTYAAAATTIDSAFIIPNEFVKTFKGIALKSEGGDKIVGFNPSSSSSIIRLHYHTGTEDSLALDLNFFSVVGFNQIKTDRSGSDLAGLTEVSNDFYPATELRYIQGATSTFTKVHFSNFFAFTDTVPNLLINSAQLVIDGVQQDDYAIPENLALRLLRNSNRVEFYDTLKAPGRPQDSLDFEYYNPREHARYPGTIGLDNGSIGENDNAFVALGDQNPFLSYSTTDKSFGGNYTLFFQQLSVLNSNKRRFASAILYPISPSKPATKVVNRTIFPKEGIKLRVYYTKPTLPLN